MKRKISLLVVLATVFSSFLTPVEAQTWTLASLQAQNLNWHSCDPGFQCASFKVPVDYNHIDNNTITLQVIKHPANKQAKRLGSLLSLIHI